MRELQEQRILRMKFRSLAFGIKQFGGWIIKENAEQVGWSLVEQTDELDGRKDAVYRNAMQAL